MTPGAGRRPPDPPGGGARLALADFPRGGGFHAQNGAERYGCGWHRGRGPVVCSSGLTVARVELEERIFDALRERVLVPDVVAYALERACRRRHRTVSFSWQTEKSWAGSCRELALELVDGSVQRVYFRFEGSPSTAGHLRKH